MDDRGDQGRKCETNQDVEGGECYRDCAVPTKSRMEGAEYALSPEKVYNEYYQHAGCDEDGCGDGEADIVGERYTRNANDTRYNSRHAEPWNVSIAYTEC